MSHTLEFFLILALTLIYIDILMLCSLILKRLKNEKAKERISANKEKLLRLFTGKKRNIKSKVSFTTYLDLKETIQLDEYDCRQLHENIDAAGVERENIKKLKSRSKIKRIEGAVKLGALATEASRIALEEALVKEENYPVKLYIANALSDIRDPRSMLVLIYSLINSHRWYREKVNMLIVGFDEHFNTFLPELIDSKKIEIKELIVDFAEAYVSEVTKPYLVNLLDTLPEEIKEMKAVYGENPLKHCAGCVNGELTQCKAERLCCFYGIVSTEDRCGKYKVKPVSVNIVGNYFKLAHKAADILAKYYPSALLQDKYLSSEDVTIRNTAVKAYASFVTLESLASLMTYLKDEQTEKSAIYAISYIVEQNPQFINFMMECFIKEKDAKIKQGLCEILSNRIEYLIMKLPTKHKDTVADIIKQILLLGRTSEVIGFLNKNNDLDIENELIEILKQTIPISSFVENECCRYLNDRLIKKCVLTRCDELRTANEHKRSDRLIASLKLMLGMMFFIFPVIYFIRHFEVLQILPLLQNLKLYVMDFNYYIAFYSIAINTIYFTLLLLSNYNVNKQVRLWETKKLSLLFKRKMLPAISIIAPAYNEQLTIVESTNSLLNLKYPEYELIIVNDGSKDNTLEVLIKTFDLIRVNYAYESKLNTKPVRGVYMNRSMPKLIVVDKENGGKADSLNVGINISNKEYFCGIDADSLLEEEALLKLASLTLDEGVETPALGGNIFPINGCTVEKGHIGKVSIPKSHLARFQTIEYMRAFMAGRLGWAAINSLLIISGAFGLFRKERVISVGGYLTSSGRYAKDTVGEDMELVVRISRLMRELGMQYRICYGFNANCWTEIPEELGVLKKQRYRWHKGLIDILTFHKKMLFNPAYGRTGLIAMPYFFIFEMLGPLIEIQGYFVVIASFFLGVLNIEIALLLFISTILMGILISGASLLIAEKDAGSFKLKDLGILILYSILENLGPRQLFSFWRVGGYLNMFKNPTSWDATKRKGFSASNTSVRG